MLLLFALASGWLFQRHLEQERVHAESVLSDRMSAWGELIQRSLPGRDAPPADQAAALREWSTRLRLPLALDSAYGQRIGTSESYERRFTSGTGRGFAVHLEDGRTLWVMRPNFGRNVSGSGREPADAASETAPPRLDRPPSEDRTERPAGGTVQYRLPPLPLPLLLPFVPPGWQQGLGLLLVLTALFVAVAAGAWPVVSRLTRRLAALKAGVERFGAGHLTHRVEVSGSDEVAAVASSFNRAAGRIEALVRSHQSLLANASHELRSPLARMKMAMSMIDGAAPAQRERLKHEIDTNIGELDALVEEVLLASRLDALQTLERHDRVDLLGLAAEEAARVDAQLDGAPLSVRGDERLLRRAVRNLLENAQRYGGGEVIVETEQRGHEAMLRVCDRGPGVPAEQRERIFEPFYRLPGHAEQAGGVGLGLSLVRQIAQRHGGRVHVEPRPGGCSRFVLSLPVD